FFSSRRRHTRCYRDWSSDVCSSDLDRPAAEKLAKEIGGIAVAADVSREDDVIRLFRQTERSLGRRITALVNNAGVVDLRSRVEEIGRASCRERVASEVGGVRRKKKE